jgi:polyketide cyclase/dehydrase/lipid transport protein
VATIFKEARVDVPVEQLWSALSDLGNVDRLLSYLQSAEMDGEFRSCSMGDGADLRELIVSVDPERRRIAYSVVEAPFEFEHHNASWRAVADGDQSVFVWETDVKPDSVVAALEPLIDQSIADIQAAVESLNQQ